MENVAEIARYVGAVLYGSLAGVAWRVHRTRGSDASRWVLVTFGLLFAVALSGFVTPETIPAGSLWLAVIKVVILALLAFPYAMHRFVDALVPLGRTFRRVVDASVVLLAVATILLPSIEEGPDAPAWFTLYGYAFVTYWAVLFGSVSLQLYRGGRGEPTLARRRIRLLSGGALLMGLAVVVSFAIGQAEGDSSSAVGTLASTLLGLGSASLFLLGFAPPGVLRVAWREPEERALQAAATELLATTSRDEVTDVLLPHLAAIVGARGVTLFDRDGERLASFGSPIAVVDPGDRTLLRVGLRQGSIVGLTSPYSPFVGEEEQALFFRLGVMADLALERVQLLDELREANDALNAANEELESFVYSASHDLKNPLIALLGYLDILRSDYGDVLDDEGRWYLERMTTNGTFMESLIQDLLELSRVGRMETEPREVDLAQLVLELGTDLRSRYPDLHVTAGPLPTVLMNPTRARQLLSNLLENAAKYGGRPDVHVEVSVDPAAAGTRVVVTDDGVGIPEEFRERVFGVFERLQVDDSKSQGTGIGLAICRKIAETLGGSIRAAPSERGARIEIDLPTGVVVEPAAAVQPTELEPSA